jgi:hypothetical protein
MDLWDRDEDEPALSLQGASVLIGGKPSKNLAPGTSSAPAKE